MKFIHHDVTPICEFVSDRNLSIIKVKSDGQIYDETSSPSDLAEMLEQSNKLWGTNLGHFFFITDSGSSPNMDLAGAIISIESGIRPGFILVAYHDGGVISVSGKAYPFQKDAEPAAWWRA